jgi:hypothetical protein
VAELRRLRVVRVGGVLDRIDGPDANVAVAGGGGEAAAIWGDVAGVDFEVFLLSCCWVVS